jgi:hypothetical protein
MEVMMKTEAEKEILLTRKRTIATSVVKHYSPVSI